MPVHRICCACHPPSNAAQLVPSSQVKEEEMRQQLAKGTPRGEGEALLAWHSPACCTRACSFNRLLHPSLLAAA